MKNNSISLAKGEDCFWASPREVFLLKYLSYPNLNTSRNEYELAFSDCAILNTSTSDFWGEKRTFFADIYITSSVLKSPDTFLHTLHAKLDHLSFTFPAHTPQDLLSLVPVLPSLHSLIPAIAEYSFPPLPRGAIQQVGTTSDGITIEYLCSDTTHLGIGNSKSPFKLRLTLPGSYLACIPVKEQLSLLKSLTATANVTFTRIDLALDVYTYPDTSYLVACVRDAQLQGNYSGFESSSQYENTTYFGSPESDKRLRFYDKSLQLNSGIPHCRFELQLRNSLAVKAINNLTNIPSETNIEYAIAKLITNRKYFDFIDRSDNKRTDRCKRLEWYMKLMSAIKNINADIYICNQQNGGN